MKTIIFIFLFIFCTVTSKTIDELDVIHFKDYVQKETDKERAAICIDMKKLNKIYAFDEEDPNFYVIFNCEHCMFDNKTIKYKFESICNDTTYSYDSETFSVPKLHKDFVSENNYYYEYLIDKIDMNNIASKPYCVVVYSNFTNTDNKAKLKINVSLASAYGVLKVVLIVIGVILVLLIGVCILICCCCCKKKKTEEDSQYNISYVTEEPILN